MSTNIENISIYISKDNGGMGWGECQTITQRDHKSLFQYKKPRQCEHENSYFIFMECLLVSASSSLWNFGIVELWNCGTGRVPPQNQEFFYAIIGNDCLLGEQANWQAIKFVGNSRFMPDNWRVISSL